MTRNVITVGPDSEVRAIASLLLDSGISAVPVVDANARVLGIVSEGDLVRRVENGGDRRESWWLRLVAGRDPADYVKSHGHRAHQVMTPDPITIGEEMPLHKISTLLERHQIKRVPVVSAGKLVGIVSRANLLRGFSVSEPDAEVTSDDREIRKAIVREVDENTGVRADRINVIVSEGRVQLWGMVENPQEKMAVQVAAENTAGVKAVDNNLGFTPPGFGGI
ncbi:CBS domain-containing protein [Methylonatrum kenyense]|uniref:CBS domain-containing protein n=1 Tax=Methylonatrum kenyense TaxID=455253 RepID=UPI0031F5CA0B